MANTVGDILGQVVQDVNVLKDEVTGTGDIVGLADRITGDVTPETRTIKCFKNVLAADTFVIDSSTKGILDGGFLLVGDDYDSGLLSSEVDQCLNKNNTFEDIFDTDTFIDSTSTGVYAQPTGLDYGYYTVDSGEELVSNIIAKDTNIYTNITISITGSNLGDAVIYVSLDNGSTWNIVLNNTPVSISNTSIDGIKYKITSLGGGMFPTAFGTWGYEAAGGTVTVNTVSLKYS